MADKHHSGNPKLVEQHKNIQHQGDEELAGSADKRPEGRSRKLGGAGEKAPGPDADTENSGSGPTGGSSVGP
jgi:hypothetical protein